jgi:hypothetical protein
VELVTIIPNTSLGGFSGVLDFRAKKARKLISLGYKDALEQLREHCRSFHGKECS